MLDILYLIATLETTRVQLPLPQQAEIVEVVGRGRGHPIPWWGRGGRTDICTEDCGEEEIIFDSPAAEAGAALPITYTPISALPGTERYVATNGSGSACTVGAPCATLALAQTAASSGDSIVVRGGVYRNEGNSCIWSAGVCTYTSQTGITDSSLTIVAYPGEIPIYNGAQDVTAAFAAAPIVSGQKCIAYSPIPVTDGSGTNFATGSNHNLNGGVEGVGKFPDQAWIQSQELQQVQLKSQVTDGKFWVDSTFPLGNTVSVSTTVNPTRVTGINTAFTKTLAVGDSITVGAVGNSLAAPTGTLQTRTIASITSDTILTVTAAFTTTISTTRMRRNGTHVLCLSTASAAQTNIEVSNKGNWLSFNSPDFVVKGIRVERYSNTQARFGVIIVNNSADRGLFENFELNEVGLVGVSLSGATTNPLEDLQFVDVTMTNTSWMGVGAVYTDDLTFNRLKSTGGDSFDEYASSPASGAIKGSRNKDLTVKNSLIADNRGNGLWLDESHINAVICSNIIQNNGTVAGDTSFFFEISVDLLLCNNYIQAPARVAAKMAGSSELRLWNNTIIGGADAWQFVADGRSNLSLNCAYQVNPTCHPNTFPSNIWEATWFAHPPTLDWMPRLSEAFNNIVANPTGVGLCDATTAFCIAAINTTAPGSESTLQSMLHQAEPGRGLAATTMGTNLYANGLATIIRRKTTTSTAYTAAQIATWKSYLAGAPVSLSGLDGTSFSDPTGTTYIDATGRPTAALDHNNCTAAPVDAVLNEFVPAGTKHCGVLWLVAP